MLALRRDSHAQALILCLTLEDGHSFSMYVLHEDIHHRSRDLDENGISLQDASETAFCLEALLTVQ